MIHHRFDGPVGAPVVVLPSSLGTSLDLWDANVPAWSGSFRVLRYDQRGHGRSDAPPSPFTVDDLGQDLVLLLDELALERVSLCGLSLGGATAMWVAANAPERVDSLVLACTAARFGEPGPWRDRAALVRAHGLEPIADGVISRWFTHGFADEQPELVAAFRRLLASTPVEGYAGCCEALARWDFRDRLGAIRARTLVLAGSEDPSTPPSDAELLADRIPDATLVVLDGAAHLANVEAAAAFSTLVREHVAPVEVG
jgi:3-oxoadipate enol-lactonase